MIFLKRRALMTRASFNYKTVSGIGSIVLENCVETKFKRLSLFGNSAQGENPNIESPKEIKNSGKYDEVSGKYVIDVSVTGKNLVPPELDFVPFGNNDPKTIEFDPKTNSYKLITRPDNFNQVTCHVRFSLRKGTYVISRKIQIDGVNIESPIGLQVYYADTKKPLYNNEIGIFRKFILKEDTNVLINLGHITNKTQKEAIIYEVQLEKSDVPTPYEPYHEPQTVQLQLDEPLTKWDRIEKRDGVYGIVYSSKHVIFNGEETWIKSSANNSFYLKGFEGLSKSYEIFCDKLKSYRGSVNVIEQNVILGNTTNLYVNIDGITDVETLRTWLSENNLDVYYFSKGSEFVALPQETQLVLESLYTFDGTTTITVDSGEVETGIEVEYAVKE